ncbi:hypothetical protein BC943DRAFT_360225 [Umbelopsis sp. AD052]|nr:hypothetical protein BC943DRAFT_360225 [Umbelopsis sp. AD052]
MTSVELILLLCVFVGLSWAQVNPGSMVNCGEPVTISDKTPTNACCSQANGKLVRDVVGQIRGCVIADYSQPQVSSAFQSCCAKQMVLYDAVGQQPPPDNAT